MRRDGIYFVGAGAQTPLGRRAELSAAVVRCRIPVYAEHPTARAADREPIIVARARWLDAAMPVPDRVVTSSADAAREALHPLAAVPSEVRQQLRVHLALEERSIGAPEACRAVAERVAEQAGLMDLESPVGVVTEGHAGGLRALEIACDQLRREVASVCLVGGADSYLDVERLEALERAGRVKSGANRWGFIPGEGAGFVLLTTGAVARHLGLRPRAQLLAVITVREPHLMGTRTVCLGEGLTAAFSGVLDAEHPVSHSYCDLNGEPYRADELGFAICRVSESMGDLRRFTAAATCWGDVGAASGVLGLTLPLAAWSRGYAPGPVALVWSSAADRPLRAAALLRECTEVA